MGIRETLCESEIRRRIFEKFLRRMRESQNNESLEGLFCSELNPDVIVISDDQSFLFEPQNPRMADWLQQNFGIQNLSVRDRVRVHPSQCRRIIKELKMAGFEVNGSVQT
jgi:hypothetical protein